MVLIMSLLTIGIPTFNRKKVLLENVKHILNERFLIKHDINLCVCDNDSQDGTFDDLKLLVENDESSPHIAIYKNDENIGVFPNIFRLFEECQSEYLLVCSDEDFVIKDNFSKILSFLDSKGPTFVSPQVYRAAELYRGRRRRRLVRPSEFNSAGFYISGLIFHVNETKNIINERKHFLLSDNIYYVQNLLVAELMISRPKTQWFVDFPLTEVRYKLDTNISRDAAARYWSVASRWEQCKAVDDYIDSVSGLLTERAALHQMELIRKANLQNCFSHLLHAIKLERPNVITEFRRGVYKKEFGRLSDLFVLFRKVFSAPRVVVRYFYKKLQ